jgi:hypothetical protein
VNSHGEPLKGEERAVYHQRERIHTLEAQLRDRDLLLSAAHGEMVALQARLRSQRIEYLLEDMGAPRKWAEFVVKDVELPAEPDEYDLADWLRASKLEHLVTRPLPIRKPE